MSQKWKVMCIIWIVCGIVSAVTGDTGLMAVPAIGTIIVALF